ncbi:tubulin domain-containing protein [Dichotomopilus funicola]|uniref:Tubulin domain-containing protein n=1 Tax=Dichotomopilus funicola TaxID=1934379 RepID=A0AAN6ZPK3_9PEZI|nr:tubulin domain-containing protein [Dichotomopilus funicola]
MHEIITLQLGQQANYLGTHFWNTQESYFTYSPEQPESPIDHDIHFRPGLAPDGTETFMPRTVIYDLKGAFGTLRKINALYDVNDEATPPHALWQGPQAPATTTLTTANVPIPLSPYLAALNAGQPTTRPTPSQVRFFSDYARVFYHPRSIVQLHEHSHTQQQQAASPSSGTIGSFDHHAAGESLFRDLDREHDLLDRDLRLFAEEADCMQGVQVFAGWEDGWGGFAARYVERLRDEYGKVGIWVWGLEEGAVAGVRREKRLLKLTNKARALTELYKQASIVIPLAVPTCLRHNVRLDLSMPWHTSALLAAAMESATLPSRLKDPLKRESLGGMADVLNVMGKQSVAGLQMSFGKPNDGDNNGGQGKGSRKLSEEDLAEGVQLDMRFTPSDRLDPYARSMNGFSGPRVFSQLVMSRGYDENDEEDKEGVERDAAGRRIRRSAYEPVTKSYTSSLRFPILDSFPLIFQDTTTTTTSDDEPNPLTDPINITTALSTDSSVSGKLKQLRATVIRSIGLEDRETLGNDLLEMADEYHEGWSSGSDEGEDD